MFRTYRSIVLAASLLLACGGASAATVSYEFDVSITDGPFTGAAYQGNFSFDDSPLAGTGEEELPLIDFDFFFAGAALSEADDPAATALFYDGDFLGVTYFFASPFVGALALVPGFFDVSESFFAYSNYQGIGFGTLEYSLTPAVVPVPAALPLLASALGAFGWFSRRRMAAAV